MKKWILVIVILLCLLTILYTARGLYIKPKRVAGDSLKNATVLDPNDYSFSIAYDPNLNSVDITGADLNQLSQQDPVYLTYAPSSKQAVSRCRIGSNTYPVLFDTGNSTLVHITAAHINENQLPVLAFEYTTAQGNELDLKLAMIEELDLGELHIKNLLATYNLEHTVHQLFGMDAAKVGEDKTLNISLAIMRQFSYIAFDHPKQRMELSLTTRFKPDDAENWKSYRLHIKNRRPYIQSTLEGVDVMLLVDTGSSGGLLLTKECFGRISRRQPELQKIPKREVTSFAPLSGGPYSCLACSPKDVTFDKCKYPLTSEINIIEKGILYDHFMENGFDGLIGLPFFDHTVMVLDFKQHTVWVKKTKGSRFEK